MAEAPWAATSSELRLLPTNLVSGAGAVVFGRQEGTAAYDGMGHALLPWASCSDLAIAVALPPILTKICTSE